MMFLIRASFALVIQKIYLFVLWFFPLEIWVA